MIGVVGLSNKAPGFSADSWAREEGIGPVRGSFRGHKPSLILGVLWK